MARSSMPSWVWLLLAVAAAAFAILWLLQDGGSDGEPSRSVNEPGRRALPPGGDFSAVQRDHQIEARERPSLGIRPGGSGGSAPSPTRP